MTWGNSGLLSTTHLDAGTDDPSQARTEILVAVQQLAATIDGRAAANGVPPLDASSKIPNTYLPDTIASSASTNLVLQPNTGVVAINYLVNLTPKTTAQLKALTPIPNMVALCSDGDGGLPCLAVYTGDLDGGGLPVWYRISLGADINI